MATPSDRSRLLIAAATAVLCAGALGAAEPATRFRVAAFHAGDGEQAHLSFVQEANRWFEGQAAAHHFTYEVTTNWNNLEAEFLSSCRVVVFLDARPEAPSQRKAFEAYMERGGAWMGFHFAAFALTPSAVPQNWDWYHNTFLGTGEYLSNTWRPTSAVLRVEDPDHPATRGLPGTFTSAPNEWYRWKRPLRGNPEVKILLSIDPSSFPLGTGPKPHEIWHRGDYPVVWTNLKYRMIYFNMGHNDLDFDPQTRQARSFTFGHEAQDRLIRNSLRWLLEGRSPQGGRSKAGGP